MIYNFKINSLEERDKNLFLIATKIKTEKEKNPNFKCIDIGGGLLNRANIMVDCIFDTMKNSSNYKSNMKIIKKDFCEKDAWEDIKDKEYDYAICTHTLEDVRDPKFVISQIIRVAKSGFITVPHKSREISFSTHPNLSGYLHHRWIFSFRKGKLIFMMKSNLVDYLVRNKKIKIKDNSKKYFFKNLVRKIYYLLPKNFYKIFAYSEIKSSIKFYELAFEFQDKFEYGFVSDDVYLPPHKKYLDDLNELLAIDEKF